MLPRMRAFHPYGITSNRQTFPYFRFPEIESHKTRQFPEGYGIHRLPEIHSNMVQRFPEIYGGQEKSPVADTLYKFPEVHGS
jgi:hypothetical protein